MKFEYYFLTKEGKVVRIAGERKKPAQENLHKVTFQCGKRDPLKGLEFLLDSLVKNKW